MSGEANNDAHRPRRIGLRSRKLRHYRQRGCARGEMQKFAAGKFHDVSSSLTICVAALMNGSSDDDRTVPVDI